MSARRVYAPFGVLCQAIFFSLVKSLAKTGCSQRARLFCIISEHTSSVFLANRAPLPRLPLEAYGNGSITVQEAGVKKRKMRFSSTLVGFLQASKPPRPWCVPFFVDFLQCKPYTLGIASHFRVFRPLGSACLVPTDHNVACLVPTTALLIQQSRSVNVQKQQALSLENKALC